MIKKIIIISVIIAALGLSIAAIVHLDSKYNMRHYFDDWKTEVDEEYAFVLNRYCLSYRDKNVDLYNIIPGYINEIYCIKNDVIYFCYTASASSYAADDVWNIASVGMDGKNLVTLYSCDSSNKEYKKLSYNCYNDDYYGGLYTDNKIYLKLKDKTIIYDIENDSYNESFDYPNNRYKWTFNNAYSSVTIEDCKQNISKTLTLASMAEQNNYAKKIQELSSQKIWDGSSPNTAFFCMVKTSGEQIYLIGDMLNWSGEAFAIVFRYDFSSDRVYFVSANFVDDNVSNHYAIIPCEESR